MRRDALNLDTSIASRSRLPQGPSLERSRRAKRRRVALESLEPRTLMAVIPGALVATQVNISNGASTANQSSPTIVVNPVHPNQLAAVWTQFDPSNGTTTPVLTRGAYSTNSGTTWTAFSPTTGMLIDPTSDPKNPQVFADASDATVAFDANDNFYVSLSEHKADNTVGALVVEKFSLAGNAFARSATVQDQVVYAWTQNAALKPSIAVDGSQQTFSDLSAAGPVTQTDNASGTVYVTWATNDANPDGIPGNVFNANTIKMAASSDGGLNFSAPMVMDSSANFGPERDTAPVIAISQGTAVTAAGTPTVRGGQVNLAWDDFGTLSQAQPTPLDLVMYEALTPGQDHVFKAAPGAIPDAVSVGGVTVTTPTNFDINVPAGTNFNVANLIVKLAINHPALNELQIDLVSPLGQVVTLSPAGGANVNGASGANMGFGTGGKLYDTSFDQSSTVRIVKGTAPYIGNYQPTGNLSVFNGAAVQTGTWHVRITDTAPNNAGFLADAQLQFTSGLTTTVAQQSVATTTVRGAAGNAYGTATATDPLGIGPGISIASDNTLGGFSPFQGKLYIAYVNRTVSLTNPADNTDIRLVSSINAGATWGASSKVNDDVAQTDGFSEGDRAQFQPSVAVDNATGTLVVSYYDGRYDGARARVATTIATSIDGGTSFGPQTFANKKLIVTDEATNLPVVIGPVQDNQSAGDPVREGSFSFGTHQGLAVYGGHVYPAWSSNIDGGLTDGKDPLNIRVALATIAAGPRILSGTSGPVGGPGDFLNTSTTADGSPVASHLIVTFDRPVDPNSFTGAGGGVATTVYTTNFETGLPIGWTINNSGADGVNGTTDDGLWHISTGRSASAGHTPTHSLYYGQGEGPNGGGNYDTGFANSGTVTTNVIALPALTGGNIQLSFNYLLHTEGAAGYDVATVKIVDLSNPGKSVTLANNAAGGGLTDLASAFTTFNGDVSSFAGDNVQLQFSFNTVDALFNNFEGWYLDDLSVVQTPPPPDIVLLARDVAGNPLAAQPTVTAITPIISNAFGATQFRVDFTAVSTPGTISYTVGPAINDRIKTPSNAVGNNMDQNGNAVTAESNADRFQMPQSTGNTPLTGPYVRDQLPLVIPGPHVTSTRVPSAGAVGTADNLVTNNTVQSINVTFDRDMDPNSFTPAQIKQIVGPAGLLGRSQTFATGTVNQSIPDNTGQPLDSKLTIPSDNGSFPIAKLTVTVNLNHPLDSDLTGYLIAPDGTILQLFSGVGGPTGVNFTGTVFDDAAATPISAGTAPFTGSFQPSGAAGLALFNTKDLATDSQHGTWTLRLVDNKTGNVGVLNSWSLTATPAFTVTPVVNPATPGRFQTFQVGFPVQQLSGTYVVTLASDITSATGLKLDQNLNAGVDSLRGTAVAGTTAPVQFDAGNVNVPIPAARSITSSLVVPQNFTIGGATVTLNIAFPHDPDLEVDLFTPDGTKIVLFQGVGAVGTTQGFQTTVLDDTGTPIANGSAPFTGKFAPQSPLSVLIGKSSTNGLSAGVYTLQIINSSATNTGTLQNWSITLQKPVVTTGLGEPIADQATATFRIFTMDPTNPLASNTWTAVGPAPIGSLNGGRSGRIGGLAVDPSDPSGNTVYVGGASGGVWKTRNFLTTAAAGPTYIPVTNFGPTFGTNIGGIAVFGRNNDTNQSEIFVATGEGDTGSSGVGVLRSMDGGVTWTWLDSSVNVDAAGNALPLNSPLRDHAFVGSTAFKILVDPNPSPTGQSVIYMALSGNNGGIWRSTDSGNTWGAYNPATGKRVANLSGQATDVTFGNMSGTINKISNPTGNLQVVYAAIRGAGVYISPNQGQAWNLMPGGVGDPLFQDADKTGTPPITVNNLGVNPNGPQGRIVLVSPALVPSTDPNAALKNLIYGGWLYAVVVAPDNGLAGIYMTKDFGQNWVKLRIPTTSFTQAGGGQKETATPTNDTSAGHADYDVFKAPPFGGQGNYDVSTGIDPTNPNILYIGGTTDGPPAGFIRLDTTAVSDAHSFYLGTQMSDGGLDQFHGLDPIAIKPTLPGGNGLDPRLSPYINLIRDPSNPFGNSTFYGTNTNSFANSGVGVKWIPFGPGLGGTDQHRLITMVDPLSGHARLIYGDDQGVWTGVDNGSGGGFSGIGTATATTGSRNGNLQITQFYYGAMQPTNIAAQMAGAMFYGSAQDDGGPQSNANILANPAQAGYGVTNWPGGGGGDASGVATDQQGGSIDPTTGVQTPPTLFQFWWPCCGGNVTDFFQVNGVGKTHGLIQASNGGNVPDPQWPFVDGFNFAVNPIDADQIIMSSAAGRFFRTEDRGQNWFVIANVIDPTHASNDLDGTRVTAPAFGAPDTNIPNNGSLDNFLYAGTAGGHIYVTTSGGGASGNQWTDISTGLSGGSVQTIIASPTRGSHEAFAVTNGGVFFNQNTVDTIDQNTGQITNPHQNWINITGQLFSLQHNAFGDPNFAQNQLAYLTSLAVDWRYTIPNGNTFTPPTNNPIDETKTHPVIYVGGEGGVYRALDLDPINPGKITWTLFTAADPNSLNATTVPPGDGGGLPVNHVSELQMALGNIDPTTGHPKQNTNEPNLLMASTFGQGAFAIRLAPTVFDASVGLDPKQPAPGGSDSARFPGDLLTNNDKITNVPRAIIDGYSEQSAFGNTVRITLIDLTDPTKRVYIGGFDGTLGDGTDIAANQTDFAGHFSVQITNALTDGVKLIGVQATDASGTKGNIAKFTYTLITATPPTPGLVLDPTSDSGVKLDNITNVTNPLFDISGIQPNNQAVLFRNGVQVAQQIFAAGGNVTLRDPGPAQPDGVYIYTVDQVDVAGNTSLLGTLNVTIKTTVAAPGSPALDPNLPIPPGYSDSGRSNTDNITNVTNPVIDVGAPLGQFGAVEPGATVEVFRSNGIGAPTKLPTVTTVAGGIVMVPDPGIPSPTDGVYIYTADQIDVAGNKSLLGPALTVTILTATPPTPTNPLLDPASDSGVKLDHITNVTSPTFDVSGIVKTDGFWDQVILLRNGKQVNQAIPTPPPNATSPLPLFKIQDPTTLADGNYVYTIEQIDVAGNVSQPSAPVPVTILTATPPTPSAPSTPTLDPSLPAPNGSDSGVKGDNVTNVTSPFLDATGILPGATVELFRNGGASPVATLVSASGGAVVIQDPAVLADGSYTYTVQQIDVAGNVSAASNPLAIQIITTKPAAPTGITLDPASNSGRNATSPYFTNHTNPVFDVAGVRLTGTTNQVTVELFRDGGATPVNTVTYTAVGAGNTVLIQDPGPVSVGTHTYTAEQIDYVGNISPLTVATTVTIAIVAPVPSAPVLDPNSDSGVKLDNITNNTAPTFDVTGILPGSIVELFRDGNATPVATQTFLVVGPNGAVMIQDPGVVANGPHSYTVEQIDLANNTSLPSPPLTVTINKTTPATPSNLTLDPNSDSGVKFDNITNVKQPFIDLSGILAGSTVELFRDGTRVNSQVFATVGSGGTVAIQDIGSPTPNDGPHVYTADQIDLAGNLSAVSNPGLTVNILTATPATPANPKLDTSLPAPNGSDSGVQGDGITNVTRPFIDYSGILPGATVELFRDGRLVDSQVFAAGGTVAIQDQGAAPADGPHTYTADQIDVASNKSLVGGSFTVRFLTSVPTPGAPVLEAPSDSGRSQTDGVTFVTQPTFDVTGIQPGATVLLFRDGTQVNSQVFATGGKVAIQDLGASAPSQGAHTYTAEQIDVAGNVSTMTPASSTVVIDTIAPIAPTGFLLDPNSDSNAKGDNITSVNNPVFDVFGVEPNALVILLRTPAGGGTTQQVASQVFPGGGNVTIQGAGAVADGVYNYTVEQVDLAGNVSGLTGPQTLTIDTTAPLPPSIPFLTAGSDSGYLGDNLTNNTSPVFQINSAEPNATVQLLRDGVVVAGRVGPGPIQDPGPVQPFNSVGTHQYQAQQTDLAGNQGAKSSSLFVTFNTQFQPPPGVPILDAGSDTSFTHNQRITSVTSPVIDIPGILPNHGVILYRDGIPVAGLNSSVGGTVSIRDPGPLVDAVHYYQAIQIDAAGNASPPGPIQSVTVLTHPPFVTSFFAATNNRNQITSITVGFNEPLALDQFLNANNNIFPFYAFHLYSAGRDRVFGTRDDSEVFFRFGNYNSVAHTVTLVPTSPVAQNLPLLFVINSPSVIFDLALNQLDGNFDGIPGGAYVVPLGPPSRPAGRIRARSVGGANAVHAAATPAGPHHAFASTHAKPHFKRS